MTGILGLLGALFIIYHVVEMFRGVKMQGGTPPAFSQSALGVARTEAARNLILRNLISSGFKRGTKPLDCRHQIFFASFELSFVFHNYILSLFLNFVKYPVMDLNHHLFRVKEAV